jgi:uncharacterized protein (TIGR00299 family) protein
VKLLYFDCPSGVSGDMTMGALLDVGADSTLLQATVDALGLRDEVRVSTRHEERGHLGGTRVLVECAEGPARTVPDLERTVGEAPIPPPVRERALEAIRRIGEAEAAVHGLPVERIHLHELGGADTMVDLVGSFWLLDSLALDAVHASPLPAPQAPHSAPATLRLLAGTGAVLVPDQRRKELVTPTGAAILAVAARFERPAMTLTAVGYGMGSRPDPGNALGAWLGMSVAETATVSVIETNLDDMPPDHLAALAEELMAAGALDVSITPILMKKGRPGHLVTVLAERDRERDLGERLLRGSTTLGVRTTRADRLLAGRRIVEVETPMGRVRVKVKELDGHAVDVAPEYEDCRRLGDVREVTRLAAEAARRELGL